MPDAAVIVFPADSNAWREGIFTSRRARKVHTTSAGAYEIATLAPGDYYLAAVSTRLALNWQDPEFLERLIAGATRVTLGAEDEKTVPLRTITLGGTLSDGTSRLHSPRLAHRCHPRVDQARPSPPGKRATRARKRRERRPGPVSSPA